MKAKQNKVDSIRQFFTSFTAESLLLHFQTIICHPSNQKFTHRIEYLIGEMFAIPERSYGSKPATMSDIQSFMDDHEGYLNKSFSNLEDFVGFDQNKLIPFFWNRNRYYFFYSLYERPYESWKELTEAMTGPDLDELPGFTAFKKQLIRSLEWQTELLLAITGMEESKQHSESIYIPSQDFIDRICPFFKNQFKDSQDLKLGQLKNIGRTNLLKSATQMGKFLNQFSIFIAGTHYTIYPQLHLQILLKEALKLIMADRRNHDSFMENFRVRLQQITRAVFKKQTQVYALLAESHEEDFLHGIADHTFWIDKNKLILFKAVDFTGGKDIGKQLNQLIIEIEGALQKIGKEQVVGIHRARKERMLGLIVEHLQIHVILIYEAFDWSFALYLKENKAWDKTYFFSMMDIRAILENLSSPIDFLKFLGEEKYLQANATVSKYDEFHDRFVWFLRNNNSYITIGTETDVVHFPPHRWSLNHAEKTFRHLHVFYDVYYEVETKFPGTFSQVEEYRHNVYTLTDPIDFETCYLSRLPHRFVWIYLPTEPITLDYNEFWSGAALFGPMLADYIARLGESFSGLLNSQDILEFDILIAPTNFLIRDKEHFPFLLEHLSDISEVKPYKFVTLPVGKRHVRTYLIFDFQHSHNIFNTEENQGERNLLIDFLDSVAFLRNQKLPEIEKTLTKMVDDVAPIGKKGYAVDRLSVDNPDIQMYSSPIKPSKTDESIARRTVAQYLRKKEYPAGVYKMESAKNLLEDVYDFLQNLLETEIIKYDEGFIVFACQQLEQNEGKIENRKLTAGMRANRRLDYSALDSLKAGMHKDSWVGSAIRLLIHTALKSRMKGRRSPTDCDWSYLLGLAVETILVATNYEFIKHNLVDIEIFVDEHYGIKVEDKDLEMDFASFSHKDVEKKMSYAIKEFEKASGITNFPEEDQTDEYNERILNKEKGLDNLFLEQFEIKYSNIILVLYILSKMELPPASEFPVHTMERQLLLQEIQSKIIIEIDISDIDKTVSFLTLKEGIFPNDKFLYFGAMLRNKERITVCPLIELSDGSIMFGREYVDSSMKIWNEVFQGSFPWVLEQNSKLNKFMKEIKGRKAKWLEKKSEEKAIAAIGKKYVECNIDNFKRLSTAFKTREACGEIDLLCLLPMSKNVFVFDCKNLVKTHGLYQAKRNIQDFFTSKDSYYNLLLRKKKFISKNLSVVLAHFDIEDPLNWKVKEGFIVNNIHYAAFYGDAKVDFVDVEHLKEYLLAVEKFEPTI
ncbi:MAG TPA: hypothetical protein VFS36_00465 [Chitinophagaceae bacterium]|nr:hypothetical protein [Chitinophagaceae bacterium]